MQPASSPSLPLPDTQTLAHSERAAVFLQQTIAAHGGSISFAEFMHHALYAPGLGYYVAGTRKLGPGGDFVTAPEISPLFGRLLARQLAALHQHLAQPSVLELGAGSGALAVQVLQQLAALDALPTAYRILEVSPDLCERQRRHIQAQVPELADRVQWVDAIPSHHTGSIVANEVLDALPIERFAIRSGEVMQICVALAGRSFAWQERPAPTALVRAVRQIEQDLETRLPDDYQSEICLAAPGWTTELADCLAQGAMFLFDYGVSRREYYAPDRDQGWVRCHFRHHAHNDPLILPGVQDITSWVDFSAVAAAGVERGLDVAGYTSQGSFLIGAGLEAELAEFTQLPIETQMKLSAAVKILTLPDEMGENFKCLCLTRRQTSPPSAFAATDRSHQL